MIPRPDNFIQIFLSPRDPSSNDNIYIYFYDDESSAIERIRLDDVKHEGGQFFIITRRPPMFFGLMLWL